MRQLLIIISMLLAGGICHADRPTRFWSSGFFFQVISEEEREVAVVPPTQAEIRAGLKESYREQKIVDVPNIIENPHTEDRYKVTEITLSDSEVCEEIILHMGLRKIHRLENFPNVKEVYIPDGVEVVRNFNDLPALQHLNLPESVTALGLGQDVVLDDYDRNLCGLGIEYLRLPAGILNLKYNVLSGCPNLKVLELPGVGDVLDGSLQVLPKLEKVVFGPRFTRTSAYCDQITVPKEMWFMDDGSDRHISFWPKTFVLGRPEAIYCARMTPPDFKNLTSLEPEVLAQFDGYDLIFGAPYGLEKIHVYVRPEAVEAYRNAPVWDHMNIHAYDFQADAPVIEAGETAAAGMLYDLQGREVVDNPAPGVYVRGGKKVLVR